MREFSASWPQPIAATLAHAAQETVPAPGPASESESTAPSLFDNPLWLFVMLGFLLWFIVLRPQKREKQTRQRLLDAMAKGDRVVSIGGIHGKIADIDENRKTVTVEVAPKMSIKFSKTAIQTVEPKNAGKQAEQTPNGKESKK